MSHDSESYNLFWCTFDEGRREQIAFPNHMIDASRTGGKKEVGSFAVRLEVARDAIDRCPEFKASFGKHFHPLVLDVASRYVTIKAVASLERRLANADARLLQQVEISATKYPYVIVERKPSGRSEIKLVWEALSVPRMVSAVQRIVGPCLERICSRDAAATWAMAHILAWTLEEFAGSAELRQSMSDLGPAEADQTIWDRAWRGGNFQAHFTQALHTLASEIATFFFDLIDLENNPFEWTEALLGLRSIVYYLDIAGEAKRSDSHVLNWVTTHYVDMPRSSALAVSEVLRERHWRGLPDEWARRKFLFQEVRRKNQEFDSMVLDCAGVFGLPNYCAANWEQCGFQALNAGRDSILLSPFEFAMPLTETTAISASDTLFLFHKAISASGLTLNAQRVLYAKMQDYTREEAHIPFGVSQKEAQAAWKELNRKKGTFLKLLSPKSRPNCTLH